jgi:CheY-like chemotaxis protein
VADDIPTILVLEDDKLQRFTLRLLLTKIGRLIEFDKGRDALAFALENQLDLAVIDNRLVGQDMTGLDFIREMRKVDDALRIILRTGADLGEIKESDVSPKEFRHCVKSRMEPRVFQSFAISDIAETRRRRAAAQAVDRARTE